MNEPVLSATPAAALRQRVIWTEGMFLRPQHFQQLERHWERYVGMRCLPLQGFYWGFDELQIDRERLALGKVALLAASGVMRDGTPFDLSHPDDLPEPLDVPADAKDALVVLALPLWRGGAEEVSFGGDGEAGFARYVVREYEVADANEVALGPALLQTGRLNVRLMLESELTGDWEALGAVRIVERRTDGRLLVDDGYIPPRLVAQRDPVLLRHTRELHGLLTQRSEALAERLSEPGRGGVSEVADFLLLQLVNRYLALTWHAQQDVAVHPEALFCDWLKLACDLSTFTAAGRRPQTLAIYRHDDLRASFGELMAELRRSLSTVLEQNAIQIELRDAGNGMKVATIADPTLRDTAGFVLAVRADVPADSLRARFPAQAKLGPVERIRDLVQLQLPGIAMRQLPVAPRQIPYHAGHTYFEIDKGGEMWKQLERSGGLAFHFAGEFPGLSMEFWAIRG
ncbi:type VI secretion system baseplate subunit TssK [Burkholderia mayonis]|uniref:Type VI secretion protein n=1 Tax=Burkholderia mayonis TaxID=1385591 RepID=A0A1B4FQX5_9BURK|nr:type VI secretion system baseplate subunit TssK [Burkholderia mayonis]AOJ06074.1 type VI secretion protein [Burkholderia mayonis]KVE56860.1 type VI secretion protein [Burkholderia mayonis]